MNTGTKLVILPPTSDEFDKVCSWIEKSHPVECIIGIHRIESEYLSGRYKECKLTLAAKNNQEPEELIAFHGCSYDSALNIANNGFDIKYNTTSAYGKGTYFSPMYQVSRGYSVMKHTQTEDYNALVVANILLGKRGEDYNSSAPSTSKRTSSKNTILSNQDKSPTQALPSIISLPINEAALPLYVVQFYIERGLAYKKR